MTQLASNLRAERARKSLSQAELADRAGTSATTVANIEGGQGCRYSTLLDLAKALGIPVGVLLAESNSAQANSDQGSVDPETQHLPAVNGASSSSVAAEGSPRSKVA